MRIFIAGRPNIQAEIGKRLAGRAKSVCLGTSKDDIVEYPHVLLDEDEIPNAMEESQEANIVEKIPENMSEMYVWATLLGTPGQSANGYKSKFLQVSLGIDAVLHKSTISLLEKRRVKKHGWWIGVGRYL